MEDSKVRRLVAQAQGTYITTISSPFEIAPKPMDIRISHSFLYRSRVQNEGAIYKVARIRLQLTE